MATSTQLNTFAAFDRAVARQEVLLEVRNILSAAMMRTDSGNSGTFEGLFNMRDDVDCVIEDLVDAYNC